MSATTPDEIEVDRSSIAYATEVSWGACGPPKAHAYRNFLEATARESEAEFERVKILSAVHSTTQKWVNGSRKVVKDMPHFTIEVWPSHDGRELKAQVYLDPWQYRKPEYFEIPLALIKMLFGRELTSREWQPQGLRHLTYQTLRCEDFLVGWNAKSRGKIIWRGMGDIGMCGQKLNFRRIIIHELYYICCIMDT